MVRAWVALAAGNRAGEVFSSSTIGGNAAPAELDREHQAARPAPMMTTAQSFCCTALTAFMLS